jgi:DNA-binding NarL/FixJ family response regulator
LPITKHNLLTLELYTIQGIKVFKISIIESQPIIREGLRALLSNQLGYEVLNCYDDFIGFLRDVDPFHPDVIFLGINSFNVNEIEAIEKIRKRYTDAKIVIFSANHQEECIKCAFRAGAHGYLHKDSTTCQLSSAVNSVAQGQFYLSTAIMPIVINCFMHSEKHAQSIDTANLTAREAELLKLISSGYKNKEIASSLCLSIKTIEAHRSNLMKKLNVHNVAGLTTKANEMGVN